MSVIFLCALILAAESPQCLSNDSCKNCLYQEVEIIITVVLGCCWPLSVCWCRRVGRAGQLLFAINATETVCCCVAGGGRKILDLCFGEEVTLNRVCWITDAASVPIFSSPLASILHRTDQQLTINTKRTRRA